MQIISWNIKGCNSSLKKRLLKRKVEIEIPSIVMLQETKCLGEELKRVDNGLGILWNPKEVILSNFRGGLRQLKYHS